MLHHQKRVEPTIKDAVNHLINSAASYSDSTLDDLPLKSRQWGKNGAKIGVVIGCAMQLKCTFLIIVKLKPQHDKAWLAALRVGPFRGMNAMLISTFLACTLRALNTGINWGASGIGLGFFAEKPYLKKPKQLLSFDDTPLHQEKENKGSPN